jgi:hypothetical protein
MLFHFFQFTSLNNLTELSNKVVGELPTQSSSPSFWVVFFIILAGFIILLILRRVWHHLTALKASFGLKVLLVKLPRETGSIDEKQSTPTGQNIQEQISVAEILWSAVGGLKSQRGLISWFKGRNDHMSLELVAEGGLISFYLAVPHKLYSFIEQQVHAHYPHATLEEVSDYNIFSPRGVTLAKSLRFGRSWAFPIKTYKQFETDPLNAVTNSLAKIPIGDGAAVQIVVRSARKSWRKRGVEIASRMQQGKRLEEAAGLGKVMKAFGALGDFIPKSKSNKKDDKPKESYKLSPLEEEMVKGIEQKASKAGMDVNIRLVACGSSHEAAEAYLGNLVNAFAQFNIYQYGNRFVAIHPYNIDKFLFNFIHRAFVERRHLVLNSEELASIYHFPLPTTETPNINRLIARRAPAPVNMPQEGIILGINSYRGVDTTVRIKTDDRRRHMYVIGKSGTGKSVMLQNMIVQDIREGKGVCVIDPHGDLVENVLSNMPAERADDVIIFDPSDTERPMGLNMLEYHVESQKDFVVQEMIAIFYKLFPPEMIGPMFEHNMRNVMLTLMADKEYPGTVADIPRMFTDQAFQKYKVSKLQDPIVRAFWEKEMAKTTDFHKSEMLGYLISKVGRFVENEMMRNIIGQAKSGFDFREVMDKRKVLLVNLSKGKTGEVNSSLLGLIIVSKLQMAAMSRAELSESERKDFYLYIDEFQNFITDSISTILSEARKYRLNLIVAHQYIGQLVQNNDTKIRDAVLGTTGTVVCFKIGVEDADIMAKEFAPVFSGYDVINIEQYNAYIKLLIDNQASRPFNFKTLSPTIGNPELVLKLKQLSRLKYARPRTEIEAEVLERTKLGEASTQAKTSPEPTT